MSCFIEGAFDMNWCIYALYPIQGILSLSRSFQNVEGNVGDTIIYTYIYIHINDQQDNLKRFSNTRLFAYPSVYTRTSNTVFEILF